MRVGVEADHAHAGVEGCAYAHEGCTGVFEASGEHAQYAAGVLVGVLVGYFDEFAVVFAVENTQGGLVGVEGFGHAQVVEFDVSGVDAVAGACRQLVTDEGDGAVGTQGGFVHGSAVVVDSGGGVDGEDCAELTVELRGAEYAQVFAGATAYGAAGAGTQDAVDGQVVAGKLLVGVFGVEHAGAFAAFAGDEFEVLFAGVEDDCINAVTLGAKAGAGVDGVCAVVARTDEQQDFGVVLAAEQVLCFGCDGVCGALHEVAVVVGGFDVGLFCFAYLGSSVDELHCCLLGWHRAGLRGHRVWC